MTKRLSAIGGLFTALAIGSASAADPVMIDVGDQSIAVPLPQDYCLPTGRDKNRCR